MLISLSFGVKIGGSLNWKTTATLKFSLNESVAFIHEIYRFFKYRLTESNYFSINRICIIREELWVETEFAYWR